MRQEDAKSKTKATDFEAIKSMTDKRLKHDLDNRKLATWENMYPDFRYGPNYAANYEGAPVDWEKMWNAYNRDTQIDPKEWEAIRDESGKIIDYRKRKTGDKPSLAGPGYFGKNGMLVKKLKKFK